MSVTTYHDGRVVLHAGDCLDVVRGLPEASIDAVVTDPPYALVSISQRFGKPGSAPAQHGRDGLYKRASAGFMGKQWDTGETAFAVEFWTEVLRVLKPGGHVAAFSGTRTYHRLAVAIEDAGFEIRDQLGWVYGCGFPKSLDVSKAIDKAAGAVREKVPVGAAVKRMIPGADQTATGSWIKDNGREYQPGMEIPATPEAEAWQGWGTALRPAWEPICLARKPLAGTVAATVLAHGTGALNVDGCRIAGEGWVRLRPAANAVGGIYGGFANDRPRSSDSRWPANILHDGVIDGPNGRYFYSAKADDHDRIGSGHVTVKPVDLMQWLVRLVTPPGGVVLDPFAGTGTTGEAAWREGFAAVLIEREAEYREDIARRMAVMDAGPMTRTIAGEKARAARRGTGEDHGPLFGGSPEAPGGADRSTGNLPMRTGAEGGNFGDRVTAWNRRASGRVGRSGQSE